MLQLIYTSASSRALGQSELQMLLLRARHANAIAQITGVLLSHNGSFLQVLEGEEATVEARFAKIRLDSRHREIRVRSREVIDQREFETWEMGFIDTGSWGFGNPAMRYENIPQFMDAHSNAKRYLRLFHIGLFQRGKLTSSDSPSQSFEDDRSHLTG